MKTSDLSIKGTRGIHWGEHGYHPAGGSQGRDSGDTGQDRVTVRSPRGPHQYGAECVGGFRRGSSNAPGGTAGRAQPNQPPASKTGAQFLGNGS